MKHLAFGDNIISLYILPSRFTLFVLSWEVRVTNTVGIVIDLIDTDENEEPVFNECLGVLGNDLNVLHILRYFVLIILYHKVCFDSHFTAGKL